MSPAIRERFKLHQEEKPIEPIQAVWHIWSWFMELSESRGEGYSGPSPITHSTILPWALLTGNTPTPLEVRLIIFVDNVWRAEVVRQQKIKNP